MTQPDRPPGPPRGATFDPIADSYDDLVDASIAFGGQEHEFFTRRKTDVILDVAQRRLGDPASLSVLDVGCGIGLTDDHLVGRFGAVHGSDPAGDAIAVAARRNPDADYRVSDSTLPYPDDTFDFAFAICVLHHVELDERAALVDEMRRVVRPGGLVGVFEHNPWNPLTRVAVSRCEFDEDVSLLTRRRTKRLLRASGLEIVESRYLLFFPFARRWTPAVERGLRGVPMGAQHYVIARRP